MTLIVDRLGSTLSLTVLLINTTEINRSSATNTPVTAYPLDVGIEQLYQRLLIHHIIHGRITVQSLLYYAQTVRGYIIRRYLKLKRHRYRIDLEHIHKVISQNLLHLLHSLCLRNDPHVLYIGCPFQAVCQCRRIRLIRLYIKHRGNGNIFFEIIGDRLGIDDKRTRHPHQEEHQTNADY